MKVADYISIMESILEMCKDTANKRYGIESTEADFFSFGIDTAIDKIKASEFLLGGLNKEA